MNTTPEPKEKKLNLKEIYPHFGEDRVEIDPRAFHPQLGDISWDEPDLMQDDD